jgi:hypothetical protein
LIHHDDASHEWQIACPSKKRGNARGGFRTLWRNGSAEVNAVQFWIVFATNAVGFAINRINGLFIAGRDVNQIQDPARVENKNRREWNTRTGENPTQEQTKIQHKRRKSNTKAGANRTKKMAAGAAIKFVPFAN